MHLMDKVRVPYLYSGMAKDLKRQRDRRRRGSATQMLAWRKYYGFSQRELEARIGISYSLIGRIENGLDRWHNDIVEALASLYGISRGDLLDRPPPPKKPSRKK